MTPAEAVEQYIASQPEVARYCIAYSGGLDSHVLLRLMADRRRQDSAIQLRAVHVDHGLQAASGAWVKHAQVVCDEMQIPLFVQTPTVLPNEGPEASARRARYAAFADMLEPDEHLLLAQHLEDQAETFLLQALRGSGPDGLSGIPVKRRFAAGFLGRPLLNCSQQSLRQIAKQQALAWVEDPSNQDDALDRNFLRKRIMPLLQERWPSASSTLARAAHRSAAASQVLMSFSEQDLKAVQLPNRLELSVNSLRALTKERAFSVVRLWIRKAGYRMPRLQDLQQVYSNLLTEKTDTGGLVNMREYVVRRYRDQLHLMPPDDQYDGFCHHWSWPFEPLLITETGQVITYQNCKDLGIALPDQGTVTIRSRKGGELIRLGKPAFHKAVKKCLQEAGVPPWMRERIPLLYVGEKLIAVWQIAVSTDHRHQQETCE